MKKILMFVASVIAFSSCQERLEETVPGGKDSVTETVTFYLEEQSKLSLDGKTLALSFQEGDRIDVNGIIYPVKRDDQDNLVLQAAKEQDNKYNCFFSGPQSYIGTGDSNVKVPNFQLYVPDGITAEAMPMICIKDFATDTEPVLRFTPLMGVIRIPLKADGLNVRSIKLEDVSGGFMSGRAVPVNESGTEVKTVAGGVHHLTFSMKGTAVMPDIVLMCNNAEGEGVVVSGEKDFYFVVEPRTYPSGLRLTVTTNDHHVITMSTSAATTVPVGSVVTMQPAELKVDENQIFAENFDTCIWGSDPVGYKEGKGYYRGLLPVGYSASTGLYGSSSLAGIERGHWYSDIQDGTDAGGATVKVLCPGSDIYANYHKNVFDSEYYGMKDCEALVMAPSFFKYRGLWDWFFSRTLEYHGYLLVGRSSSFSTPGYTKTITATGSPQGGLHTPQMTNIPEGTTCNVKLTFRIAKDYFNQFQPFRVVCYGGGSIEEFSIGGLKTEIDEGRTIAFAYGLEKIPAGWIDCEMYVKAATPKTFFQFYTPDGDNGGTNVKTATYFIDDIYVENTGKGDIPEKPVRCAFLGDSITTFDDGQTGAGRSIGGSPFYPFYGESGYPKTVTDISDVYWYKIVNDLMSNGVVDRVLARGGSQVALHAASGGGYVTGADAPDFISRLLKTGFVNPDVIFIHGGTNDKNNSVASGTYDYDTPIDDLDQTCFRSAYIKLIKILQRDYPSAQLLIIIGDMLTEPYYTAVEEIANHYNIPYVSFTGDNLPKCKGSHPDKDGMNRMANKIYNAFKEYLN